MALTETFKKAVEENSKVHVRIMLKDAMLVDPSMKNFNEMISYAEQKMPDLYDLHDGEKLKDSEADWNRDYMNEQMVAGVTNFSRERISLLKQIIRYLYKDQIPTMTVTNNLKQETEKSLSSRKVAGGIITVTGAGTMAGGIALSNIPLIVAGGVVAAGGIALIITDC